VFRDAIHNIIRINTADKKTGKVVIVVSDITRPIPYFAFLPQMLELIESSGISKDEILILVATGMHRVSTYEEYIEMFGKETAENYKIIDHNSECEEALSVAKAVGVDFSVNVILNKNRNVIKAFAGNIDSAHLAACDFVTGCACPTVTKVADVALTSSGGYPLDASFYQCVKGIS